MKQKSPFYVAFLFFILFSFASCRKHKPINPVDKLPPETQTGAGTFGCVVNGKDYLIADYPDVFATYIYLNDNYSHGYYFTIRASKKSPSWIIGILTDSLCIQQNEVYNLSNNPYTMGATWAVYMSTQNEYYSQSSLQGELRITKLDSINQFVSGTFWFDAIDTISNKTYQIRNGRFYLHYTR